MRSSSCIARDPIVHLLHRVKDVDHVFRREARRWLDVRLHTERRQLGRGMGRWIIKGGKQVFVEYAKP